MLEYLRLGDVAKKTGRNIPIPSGHTIFTRQLKVTQPRWVANAGPSALISTIVLATEAVAPGRLLVTPPAQKAKDCMTSPFGVPEPSASQSQVTLISPGKILVSKFTIALQLPCLSLCQYLLAD